MHSYFTPPRHLLYLKATTGLNHCLITWTWAAKKVKLVGEKIYDTKIITIVGKWCKNNWL